MTVGEIGNVPSAAAAAAAATAPSSNPSEGGSGAVAAEMKKGINSELWQGCAGPLVNLPAAGTHVVYFPQGHSEQVAASLRKDVDAQIPNYPNLPSKLFCLLHNVTLHADPETDEVYAQMTLQPVPSVDKEALLRSDFSLRTNKPQPDFFCKTLTASDTSTHGGFSVPRRAAEKILPPLDFSMTPPAQELVARDIHDNVWSFRHIYRGQPKRHLLTTGWSLFVSGKRLLAGDSVLFIRDDKQQLLVGIRRANRQSPNLSSSVLSTDSMHIGILAAASHASANYSPFTIFYNPRTSPSEFIIPLAKYYRAVHGNQISLGMRFRMMFETEESGTRRYMGTITGISDLDPLRWKNSQWRNLQVGWDESTAGEKRNRVSIWEIEPVTAPFFICPPPYFRSKRSRELGLPDNDLADMDHVFKRAMPWLGDDFLLRDSQALPGFSLVQWMNMQQNPSLTHSIQSDYMHPLSGSFLPDLSRLQFGFSPPQITQPSGSDSNPQRLPQPVQQMGQLPKIPSNLPGSIVQPPQCDDVSQQSRQNLMSQTLPTNQVQVQVPQTQSILQGNNVVQQQMPSLLNRQLTRNISHNLVPRQLPQKLDRNIVVSNQQQNSMQPQFTDQVNQHVQMSDNQIQQFQLMQKLQQQQQALLAQQTVAKHHSSQPALLQDQQRQMLDESQTVPRSATFSQIAEMPQVVQTSPQPSLVSQQIAKGDYHSARFDHLPQRSKLENEQTVTGCVGLTGMVAPGQSKMASDILFSNSPSTLNCPNGVQLTVHKRCNTSVSIGDEMVQSGSTIRETVASDKNQVKLKESWARCDVRPSLDISKCQNQGFLPPKSYMNAQTETFDTSSSTTSACISQGDVRFQQKNNSYSSNPHSMAMRDSGQEREIQTDIQSSLLYGVVDIDGHLGMPINGDLPNTLPPGCMVENYDNSKDAQQELSSSMVSQSFGVPEMAFNSIDSNINGPWASPQPQFQRKRTYTKVYKRGAVGRSIDMTRYSGYDDLKRDLVRRFGIEGQLEDEGRIGWKLVYVDHENDVLLVGDDPWEEFVNCVRCIRILSPQEELNGDFGSSVLHNQACSSSENGP